MRRLLPVVIPMLLLLSAFSCTMGDYSQTKSEFLLGTVCTVKLYDRVKPEALTRVFERVREIENRMSANLPYSEVSRINAAAGALPVTVSPDTLYVIDKALQYCALTGGAFDITVGPLVKLWGIGTDNARVPGKNEIEAMLPLVDYRKVFLTKNPNTVFLAEKGMALDLGAIAKGYAADEAVRILRDHGVSRAIIDFGGNIVVLGSKEKGKPWRVGVQNPSKERGRYAAVVAAADMSLVSSGTYERFLLDGGRRYHHILDTRTGYPVDNGLSDVTIVCPSSIDADGLSTSVFSLGPERGFELVNKLPGIEAVFIDTDNRIRITPGLKDIFTLSDNSFTLIQPGR